MIAQEHEQPGSPAHTSAVWVRTGLEIDYLGMRAVATLQAWHSAAWHDAGHPPIAGAVRRVVVSGDDLRGMQSGVGAAVDAAIYAAAMADPHFAGASLTP